MYIPNLLNWLPLASLTFTSYKYEDPPKKLGNLTPYRVAPASPVEVELPGDCSVDRVMLRGHLTQLQMHRHGSRGAATAEEQGLLDSLVKKLEDGHKAIQGAHLPENLRFLQQGYDFRVEAKSLTIIGRQQLFNHGGEFGLKYPNFTTDTLLSSSTERVIDSMCMSSGAIYICLLSLDRLNNLLPGVGLNDNDTHGAFYACAYDLAAGNESPWCNVFYPHELAAFEYEMDLIMDASVGYQAPDNSGRVFGSIFVNKLIERFSNASEESQSLYLEFGHDSTILAAMAAMELNRDYPPLSPHWAPMSRKFRTSYQTPFATNMIWERFTCKKSFKGPQIRLVLNEAIYPLLSCAETMQDRKYGTCSLEAFTSANRFSTSISFGDDTWEGVRGAHSKGLYLQG
ncbi:phosphoglycerate mutase-like protein [Rhizopogon vinicolor AM-OR11-026]|uniref:Phosphoglycerate mutase-like protein n=1 Tax=Rhizopogon vinicolor AM-OR11-026 TaxID=1314800 RepID=A0A1B7NAT7_9AGAM|nr:phosphoglycerate mutase-like protein [Rhizopogon vinicolor AM-OR11-026]